MLKKTLLTALLSLAVLAPAAKADITIFGDGFREDEKLPEDQRIVPVILPEYPKDERLIEFYAGPAATQRAFVDPLSFTVSGEEIRYTLVTISSGGAKNISYEGLHCKTRDYRRYAFGGPGNKWVKAKSEKWREINFYQANNIRGSLFKDYFCEERTIDAYDVEFLVKKLKEGRRVEERKYSGESY